MADTNFAPTAPTGRAVSIGLVVEDRRTGDLRRIVYVDSRSVLLRDETGSTTLVTRRAFDGSYGSRYQARPDLDPAIDGGQYDALRDRLGEYEGREGRKARHKADALREAFDLLGGDVPGTDGDGEGATSDGSTDDGGSARVPFEEVPGVGPETAGKLRARGFVTEADVRSASDEALLAVSGVGPGVLQAIREFVD